MQSDKAPELDRVLSTFTLTLYGVGVIVGAGIYVLIGRITELAGRAAWLAFFCAALCALPTGLSYAELSSRYPRSAGEAVFAERAFGRPLLSFSVGFLILASGIASTATVSRGFASYFLALVGWEGRTLIVAATFIGLLTALNHRGVRESMWVNIVCTATSVAALLLVIAAAHHRLAASICFPCRAPLARAVGAASLRRRAWRFSRSLGSKTSATSPRRLEGPSVPFHKPSCGRWDSLRCSTCS